MLQDYQIDEDTVHMFRVAAVNQVGRGPYSLPVSLTKKKACGFNPWGLATY